MKSNYVIRAMRFAEMLYPFITNCYTVDHYIEAVENFNAVYHRKVLLCHGMTRVVFITSDYVVKMDYGNKAKRWGGCADEVRGYTIAHNAGYAHLFARPTPYMVNERVFYIMPRINDVDGERSNDEDVYYHLDYEERDFICDHFADLHSANYGWKDDHPVIFDYACLE